MDFVVNNVFCLDCHKRYQKHTWEAKVQLRMRGGKKKTLKRLENDLLAANAMLEVSRPVCGGSN